jgi:hypothetical protein
MLKLITLVGGLYLLFAMLTRGKRDDNKLSNKLSEQADKAVLALATTTRWVLVGILLFVGVGVGMLLYDFFKG